ncbi:hypothetical protein B738_09861 [Photorhabdus temperata subsp. temperata M1021]|uniref:Pyosin/cloacin translocation domain-containing protein n=1 Tax=Photorhabdus temperata J3 TaxID=1389415 RepID=U7R3S0_PHOTE|nr:S-type pyocin domain-containing protein [Photorhabdus temperata]EQC00698.1 hypothetical protein B738_09861 [Photorhabdus temperata subsp. temperata M1021]ERT14623.1 hypothetical protein O185_02950 [Photorhabdus temperata J3]
MPILEKVGSDIESLPMPEEKDFRDYILIFPIPNMPPVYVYLSTLYKYSFQLSTFTR